MPSTGNYKLCYKASDSSEFVEQVGVMLNVIEATSTKTVTGINPYVVTAGVATSILLQGDVTKGDLVDFAADCSEASPSLRPIAGLDRLNTFTIMTTGVLQLCYRAAGGSDAVAQEGITLRVVEPVNNPSEDCLPVVVTSGKPFGDHCLRPLQSVQACENASLLASKPNVTAKRNVSMVATHVAEDRPYGCWMQSSNMRTFFNVPPPHSKPVGCSTTFRCLCCKVLWSTPYNALRKAGVREPSKPI